MRRQKNKNSGWVLVHIFTISIIFSPENVYNKYLPTLFLSFMYINCASFRSSWLILIGFSRLLCGIQHEVLVTKKEWCLVMHTLKLVIEEKCHTFFLLKIDTTVNPFTLKPSSLWDLVLIPLLVVLFYFYVTPTRRWAKKNLEKIIIITWVTVFCYGRLFIHQVCLPIANNICSENEA